MSPQVNFILIALPLPEDPKPLTRRTGGIRTTPLRRSHAVTSHQEDPRTPTTSLLPRQRILQPATQQHPLTMAGTFMLFTSLLLQLLDIQLAIQLRPLTWVWEALLFSADYLPNYRNSNGFLNIVTADEHQCNRPINTF